MAIGFAGISSGADWNNIIDQLLAIERKPLDQLTQQQTDLNQQISTYGQVKSSIDAFKSIMDGLRSVDTFAPYSAGSTNESVLTASANSSAVAGSYDVVVSQLASNDKIASSAYTDSATAVGTGTLSITVNGETLDITVDSSNNTLTGLRDAINNSSSNPGVTATILNESGGSRLILTGTATGASNAINISVADADDGNNSDEYGLSKLFHIGAGGDGLAEQLKTAADAQLTIDGFDVTSSSNTVAGAIGNVSLYLAATGSATVQVERDDSQVQDNVQKFVDAYNNLMSTLGKLETSLGHESGIRQIEQGLTNILNQSASINGTDTYLFEAGITRDRYGVLSLDSGTLADSLNQDFDKIKQLFTDGTEGFAKRFYDYTNQLLEAGGIVSSREEGLDSRMRSIQDQIDRQNQHLDVVEKTLVAQFSALDKTVATLQSTSNYLTAQLSSLVGSKN